MGAFKASLSSVVLPHALDTVFRGVRWSARGAGCAGGAAGGVLVRFGGSGRQRLQGRIATALAMSALVDVSQTGLQGLCCHCRPAWDDVAG